MIFTDDETGLKYEVLNRGRTEDVTHFLETGGSISPIAPHYLANIDLVKLRLIRPRHTFGGVVYEEAGEKRKALAGEWILEVQNGETSPTPAFVVCAETYSEYPILRPVAIEASK